MKDFAALRDFYRKQLLDDCVPFWMNGDLLDTRYGGYITSLDREGKMYNSDKSVWFQGRGLWTFSTLCAEYGEREDLRAAAESGKAFLEQHCTDADGRMFFTVTRDGRPLRKRRYVYSESFWVLGMAAYAALTGDERAKSQAESVFDLMVRIYRDPAADPYKITPKSYASTRAERALAVPMVLMSCAQTLRRICPEKKDYYTALTREFIDDVLRLHYKPEYGCLLETVGPGGEFIDNPAGRTVNPGHSVESAWFMMSEAVCTDDRELLQKCLNIIDGSLELGLDRKYGGIFYFVDVLGRPPEPLEWDMKLWWVHNEFLIAALAAYELTKDEKYLRLFEQIHDYAFDRFRDKEYGEWYGYLHRDGSVSHTQKGSMWKGPYHLPRCLMYCERILGRLADGRAPEPLL